MCGWMSECGLILVLTLSLCQAKSLASQHDFPYPILGSSPAVSGSQPDFSQSQSLGGEMEKNYEVGGGAIETSLAEDSVNSMENALLNYLYTKNMMRRMKQQLEASSLFQQQQRKRTNGNYWKMCAFNAVSCFG